MRRVIAAGRSNSIYRGTIPEGGFAGTGIGTSENTGTKHPRCSAAGPMDGGKRAKIGKLVAKTIDLIVSQNDAMAIGAWTKSYRMKMNESAG